MGAVVEAGDQVLEVGRLWALGRAGDDDLAADERAQVVAAAGVGGGLAQRVGDGGRSAERGREFAERSAISSPTT